MIKDIFFIKTIFGVYGGNDYINDLLIDALSHAYECFPQKEINKSVNNTISAIEEALLWHNVYLRELGY